MTALSKEDIEDLRTAKEMEDLIHSPGWKLYAKILEKHIEDKTKEALMPTHIRTSFGPDGSPVLIDGISQVLFGEASKGAIMGLRLALSLPSGIVAGAAELRARFSPSAEE